MDEIAWGLIDKYFKENPYYLVAHHLDTYNDFFSKGIYQIFKENNPIRWIERDVESAGEEESNKVKKAVKLGDKKNANECQLYLGGINGDKIYFGKPIIYDEINYQPYPHYMYPNDARLRNMTYGITIHYDVDVEYSYYVNGESKKETKTYEKIFLGRFPIMLHSNLCILRGMTKEARYNVGECRNDYGGYFIIGGKEKVIVSQEKFGDNMLYVRKYGEDDLYSYSCEVHSVSEDSSKPIRFTSVKIIAPDDKYTNNQIVVDIPNVKKPVPLFILMRALGVISDKLIIEYCLLDLDNNSNMIDLFIPSVHDANTIFTQELALEFISKLTKRQTVSATLDILMNYFLPHIGEDNFLNKAYFIGFMVNKILRVFTGKEAPTDRDNFKFKRIETSGSLIYDLFREHYLLQNRSIFLHIDKNFYYHAGKYRDNFVSLIEDNIREIFQERIVENGFKKGFKGNWGASSNTKRIGIVQDLNRLSWFTHMSHLRKVNLPLDATAKVVGPHLLHSTQWGIIDPVDTPDGGNIGLHKHLSISTSITNGFSSYPIIKWIRANTQLQLLTECRPNSISNATKVFVNGNWIGVVNNPIQTVNNMKLFRRNGVIPAYTSISFHYESNIIYIYTDGGRLTRPIFYRDMIMDSNGKISYGKLSYERESIHKIIEDGEYSWLNAVTGFKDKLIEYKMRDNILYDVSKLYPEHKTIEGLLQFFEKNRAIVDYIDTSEEESSFISTFQHQLTNNKFYTHREIDPSLIFGVMGNSIIYPESNQFPRNCFSCGQSRQAVALYHSNPTMRMDKTGVVLNYGQVPLIKSRYLKYINNEEHPYGVNAIVAIMSYTGYNVEDAILINEGSVKRGIFRTTYYTTYESREESSSVAGSTVNTSFTNIESKANVKGIKDGYDYSKLDEYGIVRENTEIDDRIVLIGEVTSNIEQRGDYIDKSVTTKKGQLGFVDKSFISDGEEGFRIAKVRIREERLPAIGDKMASRAGQKGTIGLIIPEEDMPFTADGIRPDLIINPHAIPSRMTIGQLVENNFGKACCIYGSYGDCTAFSSQGSNYNTYGQMLTNAGFSNTGNEILYSGFSGEQLYADIFIGPTYYMRLKHMVKDKINYRATGKRNVLTRQTNQGRANDGGLRIGEMERDGIMAHGLSYFLNESFMVRGDQYYMGICNSSGAIAIYNPDSNLFFSPFADGPIGFTKNINGNEVINAVSKFGRSFSLVRIPFAMKLLIQELQTMNVQMRIVTEDNIDQLLNLSYQSRNLEKLLHISESEFSRNDIATIIQDYKNSSKKKPIINMSNTTELTREELIATIERFYKFGPDEVDMYTNDQLKTMIENFKQMEKQKEMEKLNPPKELPLPDFNQIQNDPFIDTYKYANPDFANGQKPDFNPYATPQNRTPLTELGTPPPLSGEYPSDLYQNRTPLTELGTPPPLSGEYPSDLYQNRPPLGTPPLSGQYPSDLYQNRTPLGTPPLSGQYPSDLYQNRTPLTELGTPPSYQNGGSTIFNDPNMNKAFDQLSSQNKQKILMLDPRQRESVVREIVKRTPNLLDGAFKALPLDKQFIALQGGYNSMAKEFSTLAKTTPDPLVTINRPIPVSDQLAKMYPMLAVDENKHEDEKQEDKSSSSSSSSSSSDENMFKIKKLM
jgi:DNA-directed RNA polymerase II subunit RPB2